MLTEEKYRIFFNTLLDGNRNECFLIVENFLEDGVDIKYLYINVFQRSLIEIGSLWQKNMISVAKEHLCTAIIQSIMMMLYNYIRPKKSKDSKVIIACVGNELHEVGARMVADFFEMEGWVVFYLGANVPARDILGMVESEKPDVLGISCTISTHIEYVKNLITAVRDTGSSVRISTGGYCFNKRPELYKYVGADFWCPDALETVQVSNKLILKI